jgi:hypothetical protein
MAYTGSPTISTYSTKDLPVSTDILLRPSSLANNSAVAITQDAGMINLIPINTGGNEVAITRPNLVAASADTFTGVVRGFYVWEISTSAFLIYVVIGTSIYWFNGTSYVSVNTFTNNVTTPVRFAEFIDATNTKKLLLVDGTEGFIFPSTGGAGTKIVDPDFPSPHVPFPVVLDGYMYLAKAGTGDIYNSNLNDPSAWTAGDFLSAEMYPDNIQALVRVNNYILAIGTQSSEYFYDAANATASPLARVDGAALPFGTLCPNSVAVNRNTVILLANNNDGEATIASIENQRFTDIGGNFIVPLLSSRIAASLSTQQGVIGYFFRHRSELFYGLCFSQQTTTTAMTPQYSPTFIYSFSAKKWTEFRLGSTGTAAFPVCFTQAPVSVSLGLTTYCVGNYSSGGTVHSYLGNLIDATSTATDTIGSTSNTIYQEFRTPNLEFDTMNRKFMSRVGIEIESGDSSFTTTDSLTLAWSDNDYQSWSSTTLPLSTMDAGSSNNYFPFVTQLGSFRRRAIKGSYVGKPIRLYKLQIDINKGQQ